MEPNAEYFPCPTPEGAPDCPYQMKGCHEDTHHLFYPAEDYKTVTEKVFRNLPENQVTMCRYLHDKVHKLEAEPPKPDRGYMVERIAASGLVLSLSKHRRIYGTPPDTAA